MAAISLQALFLFFTALLQTSTRATTTTVQCNLNLNQECMCDVDMDNKITVKCRFTNEPRNQSIILDNGGIAITIHELDLSSCNLREIQPQLFQGISSINTLLLTNNSLVSIDDIPSMSINTLLHTLDLCENNFKTVDISSAKTKFPSLKSLRLCSNKINSIVYTNDLSKTIQELDLSNNQLTHVAASLFSEASNIDLSSNSLVLSGQGIKNELRQLNLSNNGIEVLPVGYFSMMGSLQYLDLSRNKLSSINDETFQGLRDMTELDLSENLISEMSTDAFTMLSGLNKMDLGYNEQLKDVTGVRWPTSLNKLGLQNTGIEQLNVCRLFKLRDLEELTLTGNQMKCSCHLEWMYNTLEARVRSGRNQVWSCLQDDGNLMEIKEWNVMCEDHVTVYLPNHCVEEVLGEFILDVDTEDDDITVRWDMTDSSIIGSFQVVIKDNEQLKVYQSSTLERNLSQFIITDMKHTEDFTTCLELFDGDRTKFYEQCVDVSGQSLQIIVGILAGVIFLIPCLVALAYIIYKDRQKMKEENYLQLQDEEKKEILKKEAIPEKMVKNDNQIIKSKPPISATNDTSVAIGHENLGFENDRKQMKDTAPKAPDDSSTQL